jgi:hypothetical protein
MRVSGRAADLAADVLGAAGVGHPSYAMRMADYQAGRSGAAGQHIAGTAPADDAGGEAPTPPPPPTSPDPPPGGSTNGPLPGGGTPNVPPGGEGAGGGPAQAGAVPEVPA